MADFRREYNMTSSELAGISLADFQVLIKGLSEHSRFAQAWAKEPKNLYDRSDIEAVKAAARR